MNDEVLELFHTRLMTLELIVSEMHETLINNGLIDKDEFNSSLNKKIKEIKRVTKVFEDNNSDDVDFHIPNLFGGPIGEA